MSQLRFRILIVEDEMLVAMNIEEMLIELGHEVVGMAGKLEQAMEIARNGEFDLAMLDVNLAGQHSFPVAEILAGRGIPFLFATGYGAKEFAKEFRDAPVLQKPFRAVELANALASLPFAAKPGFTE